MANYNVDPEPELTFVLSTKCKRIFAGILIVIVISMSQVGGTQLAKTSYSSGKFAAPLFIVWFNTSWMMALFPLSIAGNFVLNPKEFRKSHSLRTFWSHCVLVFSSRGITWFSILTSTVLFTALWVATNYLYARALIHTAATDVTALASSSSAFVFLLSVFILKEPVLILRVIAVALSCGGIVLFAYADGFEPASITGVLLSVASAIGIALYKVLLKWRVNSASMSQMSLFLSTLGGLSTIALLPVVMALHFRGVETLTYIPWLHLIGMAILGVVFNFMINFGVAYTYPLFISVGAVLAIPFNAMIDSLVNGVDILNWKLTAIDLIVSGFLLLLAPPSDSVAVLTQMKRLSRWLLYLGNQTLLRLKLIYSV